MGVPTRVVLSVVGETSNGRWEMDVVDAER